MYGSYDRLILREEFKKLFDSNMGRNKIEERLGIDDYEYDDIYNDVINELEAEYESSDNSYF